MRLAADNAEARMRQDMLAHMPVKRLLWKLSVPAIAGMATMTLYNVVDTIYIGHGVGPLAIAGVTVAFPVMILLMAFGMMIGIGSASVISRNLGMRDMARAERTLGNAVFLTVASGLVIGLACLPNITWLMHLFGSSEAILPYAKEYLSVILLGAGFAMYPMAVNDLARAEGNVRIAMTNMILGAVLNIVLDPIFIFALDMGVGGAAIATVISQAVTALYVTRYFRSGRSTLHLSARNIRPDWPVVREIVAIGFPAFIRMGAASLITVIINRTLGLYGGDLSVAAYGIVNRTMMFAAMPLIGIGQGLQPVLGFNYGARQYSRALEVTKYALQVGSAYSVLAFLLLVFFARYVTSIFTGDAELIAIGARASRFVYAAFFLVGFQIVGSVVFQSLGRVRETFVTSASRQVLLIIPLVLVLPGFLQADGIWLAFPVADALSFVLVVLLMLPQLRESRRLRDLQAAGEIAAPIEDNPGVGIPLSVH